MIKNLAILVLCLFVLPTEADAQFKSKSMDLAHYHRVINEAELFICSHQYDSAFSLYSTFSIENLYFKDLFNFFVVSTKNGDTSTSIALCYELAERGVDDKFFSSSVFLSVKGSLDILGIPDKAKSKCDEIRASNEFLLHGLDSLYFLDQEIFSYKNNRNLTILPDSLSKINDNNMAAQLHLIKLFGFPSEQLLGPKIFSDTLIGSYINYIFVPIHNLQKSYNESLVAECRTMYSARFFDGFLDQSSFQMFQELAPLDRTGNLGSKVYCTYNGKLYKSTIFSEAELAAIDLFRKQYFFSSLKDLEKKLRFKVTPDGKTFYFNLTYNYYPSNRISEREFANMREAYAPLQGQ